MSVMLVMGATAVATFMRSVPTLMMAAAGVALAYPEVLLLAALCMMLLAGAA